MADRAGDVPAALIDVHAHCLSPAYRAALADAGLITPGGGYPIPEWSPERAIAIMNDNGIEAMLLSVTSPTVGFLDAKRDRIAPACRINEDTAAVVRDHPGRFGGFATLPLPYVPECIDEVGRALDELGPDGIVIETNSDGIYLGNRSWSRCSRSRSAEAPSYSFIPHRRRASTPSALADRQPCSSIRSIPAAQSST